MIALKLTNIKEFMNHLLLLDTFDHFQLIEGEIVTFNTFKIDGFLQKSFYEETEDLPEYSSWESLRDYCFSLIRGKRTPLSFRFIFSLSSENVKRLILQNHLDFSPEEIQGLYLNIKYENSALLCITGTSFKTFTMDKSLEQAFDLMVQKFFSLKQIPFEPAS